MTQGVHIRIAGNEPLLVSGLSDLLMDCVAGGASVSFLSPLSPLTARRFWEDTLASVGLGERILLVAEDTTEGNVVGTVQVVSAVAENQPHRADVAKMLVRRDARRRGLGAALMRSAEQAARDARKSLLVLDTVTGSDAARLYTRLGWQRCGDIPGYALWPQGGLCSTTFYYKSLA